MLFEYIVNHCEKKYNAIRRTSGCSHCNHPSRICSGNCDNCLIQVHWGPKYNEREDYNCEKLIYRYVTEFAERYTNNILYLLKYTDFEEYPFYNILTGIDLSQGMLDILKSKFPDKEMNLIQHSYFDVPFGTEKFDCAISVESLHHFTKEEKIPLYTKLYKALKNGGYFILTDYFSLSDEEEIMHRENLAKLKAEQGITDNEFYHYDTPLTIQHEIEALLSAEFKAVEVLNNWGATYTLKARK